KRITAHDPADGPVCRPFDHRALIILGHTLQYLHRFPFPKMGKRDNCVSLNRFLASPHTGQMAVCLLEIPVGNFQESCKLRLQYFRFQHDIFMMVGINAFVPRTDLLACVTAIESIADFTAVFVRKETFGLCQKRDAFLRIELSRTCKCTCGTAVYTKVAVAT